MRMPSESNIELPLLKVLGESPDSSLTSKEAVAQVTKFFPDLTQEALASELPTGGSRWANRVAWTRHGLMQKGHLSSARRGVWKVTTAGRKRIAKEWDSWEPVYRELGKPRGKGAYYAQEEKPETPEAPENPLEIMEQSYEVLLGDLKRELVERAKSLSANPSAFEHLIGDLLEATGYSHIEITGRAGDGGIDGLCRADKIGLQRVAFQAKCWKNMVPPKEIRDFVGGLNIKRVQHGIFITTSDFTKEAQRAAEQAGNVILVTGDRLAELMIEAGLGVTKKANFDVFKVDEDYYEGWF